MNKKFQLADGYLVKVTYCSCVGTKVVIFSEYKKPHLINCLCVPEVVGSSQGRIKGGGGEGNPGPPSNLRSTPGSGLLPRTRPLIANKNSIFKFSKIHEVMPLFFSLRVTQLESEFQLDKKNHLKVQEN